VQPLGPPWGGVGPPRPPGARRGGAPPPPPGGGGGAGIEHRAGGQGSAGRRGGANKPSSPCLPTKRRCRHHFFLHRFWGRMADHAGERGGAGGRGGASRRGGASWPSSGSSRKPDSQTQVGTHCFGAGRRNVPAGGAARAGGAAPASRLLLSPRRNGTAGPTFPLTAFGTGWRGVPADGTPSAGAKSSSSGGGSTLSEASVLSACLHGRLARLPLPRLRHICAVAAHMLHKGARAEGLAKTAVAVQAGRSATSRQQAQKRARLKLQRAATVFLKAGRASCRRRVRRSSPCSYTSRPRPWVNISRRIDKMATARPVELQRCTHIYNTP